MAVYKGWYRKSCAKTGQKWHRVTGLRSETSKPQVAQTLCGQEIPTAECDFVMRPTQKCRTCEAKEHRHRASRQFVPTGRSHLPTKTSAKTELKRLLKVRTYYVELHGPYLLAIEVAWRSDVSLDVECYTTVQTDRKPKKVTTFDQVVADMGRFKTAIDCLIQNTDMLAVEEKQKRGLSGELTEDESQKFFEDLLADVEKK